MYFHWENDTYIGQQCGVTADTTQADQELQSNSQIVAPPLVGHQSIPSIFNLRSWNLVSILQIERFVKNMMYTRGCSTHSSERELFQDDSTFAVMNMRLLSTSDVACREPHPLPFRLGDMLWPWPRVSSSGVQGLEAGGMSPVSSSSMLLSQGSR